MRLALLELRRRPGRFGAATGILLLLATLLLFLGGLVEGLTGNNDGFIRTQRGDLVVFSSVSERVYPQSVITEAQRLSIADVPGVDAVGQLSIAQLAARTDGPEDRDLTDVVVIAFEQPIAGASEPPSDGTALADEIIAARGITAGSVPLVGPNRTAVEVTGTVDAAGYQIRGTLWVSPMTFADVVAANRPDAALSPGASQLAIVDAAPGHDLAELAATIERSVPGVDVATVQDAAAAVPDTGGGTLQQIITMTLVIAIVVVALFFALLTTERVGLDGVLKAIGARNRTLVAGVVVQAAVLSATASAAALGIAFAADAAIAPGSLPFAVTASDAALSVASLMGASVLGAALSLRRVIRIDPATAIGAAS